MDPQDHRFLPLPPSIGHLPPHPVPRQRACAGRSGSLPPSCEPPFHPGNRGATTARARAGRGPGGVGAVWGWGGGGGEGRPRAAVLACPTSLRLASRVFDAASGPVHIAPGHGLPESKWENEARGAAEVAERVGGAPGAGGRRARWARLGFGGGGPGCCPPSLFPSFPGGSRLRGPRPVTPAGLWPRALAPAEKKGAVPIPASFSAALQAPFDSGASPRAGAGLSLPEHQPRCTGLPADADSARCTAL